MKLFLCISTLLLMACEPIVDSRGYNPDTMDISKIKMGKTTKDEVMDMLGSPSTVAEEIAGLSGCKAWYYISKKTETTSFYKPKIMEQKVIRVVFDCKNVVKRVDDLSNVQGIDLEAASEQTATTGYEESLGNGVLGTFTRMVSSNKKKKTSDD